MEPDRELEAFYDSFFHVFRHIKRNQGDAAGGQAITRTQWFILRELQQHESRTIGQLAEVLEVRPSTMSQMLDRLELSELICREQDKHDGRTRNVRLTEKGAEIFISMRTARIEVLAEPFKRMREEERRELIGSMAKLAKLLSDK